MQWSGQNTLHFMRLPHCFYYFHSQEGNEPELKESANDSATGTSVLAKERRKNDAKSFGSNFHDLIFFISLRNNIMITA